MALLNILFKYMSPHTLFLFLLLSLTQSLVAHAVDIDVSIGQAKWERSDNGTWWSLGLSDKINDRMRWNVGYTNLGVIDSYGEAVGDDVYGSTHGCTTGPCPTSESWYGKGQVDGVYFTLSPQFTVENLTYTAEIGVWNYNPQSRVVVPDQHPCGLCSPSPGRYMDFVTASDRMWGQVFGIGLQYKRFFTKFRMLYVESSDREYPAIYQKYAQELSFGVRF
jgi:hypothetical protein